MLCPSDSQSGMKINNNFIPPTIMLAVYVGQKEGNMYWKKKANKSF